MTGVRRVAVIDIGKTNAKLTLVDLPTLRARRTLSMANLVRPGPPWPHHDLEAIWTFVLEGLRTLHASDGIDAIATTAHGASVVLLDQRGQLAAPMLDYEHDGPDRVKAAYEAIRPDFALTGSPRQPLGLSAGAQLHWQLQTDPGLAGRIALVLTYPQYWSYRLTGIAATEVTALSSHSDLWEPYAGRFSPLVEALGLQGKIAGIRRADARLGPIAPQVARATGLPGSTPVVCGIHDSNATLYPHLLARKPPFAVVSTGTWVIVMAVGGQAVAMDQTRDSMVGTNALGQPVPSARFMGGRTFDLVLAGRSRDYSREDVAQTLARRLYLMPSVVPESGPFPGRVHRWSQAEATIPDGQRLVALSFHLALMAAECLSMTGADGPVIVEGPFTGNPLFMAMLQAATGRAVGAGSGLTIGTSLGAALLFGGSLPEPEPWPAPDPDPALAGYARGWRQALAG